MKNVLFILFGAPASGKGFLGDKIKQEVINQGIATNDEMTYLSTGDLLRKEMALQTPVGNKIKQLMNEGHLVPDEIVNDLVAKAFTENKKIMFLDGYPRTTEQLANLAGVISSIKNPTIVMALKRDIPSTVIVQRAENRRVCALCRSTHTALDGQCPKCGGPSIIRQDDAKIYQRLSSYERHTEPMWPELSLLADLVFEIPYLQPLDETVSDIIESCYDLSAL